MKTILILYLIFVCCTIKAQRIDRIVFPSSQNDSITYYIITNNTDDDMLTWLSKNKEMNTSQREKIVNYFNGKLLRLILGNKTFPKRFRVLGKTFIKRILPNEKFIYIIKGKDSDHFCLRDFIVTAERKKVEMYMLTHILDIYFYPKDMVLVNLNKIKKHFSNKR